MVLEELLKGESRNIEYKSELPKRSERYMKSVVAFSNTGGGKRITVNLIKGRPKDEIKDVPRAGRASD